MNYFQESKRSIFHFNEFQNVWKDKIPLKVCVFKYEPGQSLSRTCCTPMVYDNTVLKLSFWAKPLPVC